MSLGLKCATGSGVWQIGEHAGGHAGVGARFVVSDVVGEIEYPHPEAATLR
jgi:hypothetical protein